MSFSPKARAAANALVACHETGKPVGDYSIVAVLTDGAGISYGTHQATHKAGSLYKICKLYCDLSPSEVAKQLIAYLPTLRDPELRFKAAADATLKDLLRRAGQEQKMRYAQNKVFDRNYLEPAMTACEGSNFKHPLSLAVIYDSMIQGGYAICRDRVKASGEQQWVKDYVAVRRSWLGNHPKPIVRKTVYRMATFEKLIQDGNWNLEVDFFSHSARVKDEHLNFWLSAEEPATEATVTHDEELKNLFARNTEGIADDQVEGVAVSIASSEGDLAKADDSLTVTTIVQKFQEDGDTNKERLTSPASVADLEQRLAEMEKSIEQLRKALAAQSQPQKSAAAGS